MLQRLGRLDESLEAKKKSSELSPQDAEAAYNLGNALNEVGRFDEAKESYQRAIKVNPNFIKANYNLALVFSKTNQIEKAITHYHREIKINPTFAEAHSNLGNLLKNSGDLDAAQAAYKKLSKSIRVICKPTPICFIPSRIIRMFRQRTLFKKRCVLGKLPRKVFRRSCIRPLVVIRTKNCALRWYRVILESCGGVFYWAAARLFW